MKKFLSTFIFCGIFLGSICQMEAVSEQGVARWSRFVGVTGLILGAGGGFLATKSFGNDNTESGLVGAGIGLCSSFLLCYLTKMILSQHTPENKYKKAVKFVDDVSGHEIIMALFETPSDVHEFVRYHYDYRFPFLEVDTILRNALSKLKAANSLLKSVARELPSDSENVLRDNSFIMRNHTDSIIESILFKQKAIKEEVIYESGKKTEEEVRGIFYEIKERALIRSAATSAGYAISSYISPNISTSWPLLRTKKELEIVVEDMRKLINRIKEAVLRMDGYERCNELVSSCSELEREISNCYCATNMALGAIIACSAYRDQLELYEKHLKSEKLRLAEEKKKEEARKKKRLVARDNMWRRVEKEERARQKKLSKTRKTEKTEDVYVVEEPAVPAAIPAPEPVAPAGIPVEEPGAQVAEPVIKDQTVNELPPPMNPEREAVQEEWPGGVEPTAPPAPPGMFKEGTAERNPDQENPEETLEERYQRTGRLYPQID
jgi:hypothetical protein